MKQVVDLLSGPFDSEESYSLIVLRNSGRVALGRKTGGFAAGKLVLPGGKDRYYLGAGGISLVSGLHNARREAREETGANIAAESMKSAGRLLISTETDDIKDIGVFVAHCQSASLANSVEVAELAWHPEDQIPYAETLGDYKYWLPDVLAGYSVIAFLEAEGDQLLGGNVFRQQLEPLGRLENRSIEI